MRIRIRRMSIWDWLELWLESWADLIDAICRILAMGFWSPNLAIRLAAWAAKRALRKRVCK